MGLKIKALRKAAGLTQLAFAEKIGVLRTSVANWELGLALPQTSQLPAIADALGCTIDELFDR